MLIEFSVENFKSIKDKVTFSMLAAPDTSLSQNVAKIKLPKIHGKKSSNRILKTSVIYGANASGKSNILKAIDIIKQIILHSNMHQPNQTFPIDNFRLDLNCANKPTNFEFIFVHNNTKYAYNVSLTKKKVLEENLYFWPNGRQVKVFERTNNEIEFGSFYKSKNKEDELRNRIYAEDTAENILFLSMANRVNIPQVKEVFHWFATKLVVMYRQNGIGNDTTRMISEQIIKREDVLNLLKVADAQIEDFELNERELDDNEQDFIMNNFIKTVILPQIARQENVKIESIGKIVGKNISEKTKRLATDEKGDKILVDFDLADESEGTQRYYGIIGPLLCCLQRGCTVFFDELELRLHPLLSKGILELFTSEFNSRNTQLIITTHNVNLLDSKGLLRRDQIWLTEKDDNSTTSLYSLDDFKGIRNSMIHSKNYLRGKFGAIPDLDWENLNG